MNGLGVRVKPYVEEIEGDLTFLQSYVAKVSFRIKNNNVVLCAVVTCKDRSPTVLQFLKTSVRQWAVSGFRKVF